MILTRMKSMYCDQFPDLIKKIGEVAQRNTSERITLTIDEKKIPWKTFKKKVNAYGPDRIVDIVRNGRRG